MYRRWVLLLVLLLPTTLTAGWVDDWLIQKQSSGSSGYESARRGYYTGGGMSLRWPNTSDHPVSITAPRIKSGCGGIDLFLGGVSFLNVDYLVQKLQNILSAAPAAAFDIALKTMAPQVADTIKTLESIIDRLNGLQLQDCKAARALVATAASPFSPVMTESMQAEMKNAQTDFLVSSGAKDLYQSASSLLSAEQRQSAGNRPAAGSTIQNSTTAATAGCSEQLRQIFGEGSLLENLATQQGLDSAYISLIRGFVGDVVIASPASTGSTYQATYRPPCAANDSYDAFMQGSAEGRDSDGVCRVVSDINRDLTAMVVARMQSIAGRMKGRQALTSEEEAFLKSTPLAVSQALKAAVSAGVEQDMIARLAEVTTRSYAYYLLVDLFNRTEQLQQLARSVMAGQRGNRPGSMPESCQLALLGEGLQQVTLLEERTLHLLTKAQQRYAASAAEITAMDQLLATLKRFDQIVFSELQNRFGSSLASRLRSR
jgi:conjugative transfer pilus assembly protein TraH